MSDNARPGVVTLGDLGQGTIEPAPRVAAGSLTADQLEAFVSALSGDGLFTIIDGVVPCKCVDGRPRADGGLSLGPDAAGGTESLAVGDALTYDQFCEPGGVASDHATRVAAFWVDRGARIGGHDADNAHGGSGCGACDKLEQALVYIGEHANELRDFIESLGVTVDGRTQLEVAKNARNLAARHYADGGTNIIAALRAVGGKDSIETLMGEHKEVAVIINTKVNTTLDRSKVRAQFGDELQAFNVDVWALERATSEMYPDNKKAHSFYYATLCYNVAVAAVLSGPSLRIVVR